MALRSQDPLDLLDASLLTGRRGGGAQLLQAWGAGLPVALAAIGLYYVERVEGIRNLRLPFALALVLAFLTRCVLLSRVARRYALAVRPSLPVATPEPAWS